MLNQIKLNIIILLLPLLLYGCAPAIFATGAASTVAIAKDQPAKDTIKDAKISAMIKASFMKRSFSKLYAKISIDVISGIVLYTGNVDSEADIINAMEIAWDQDGVKEVINELKIDENSNNFNLVQYTKDSLITAQIKSQMFLNREIKSPNYTIVTMNNIVYLFGMARSPEELEKVAKIASEVRGVEKVICHLKTIDSTDINSNQN